MKKSFLTMSDNLWFLQMFDHPQKHHQQSQKCKCLDFWEEQVEDRAKTGKTLEVPGSSGQLFYFSIRISEPLHLHVSGI